ncbi:MAG: hypothetical protein A2579_02005 [Lysobacterales bacterium RIFOXYD1_FULL_69_11]|nr:MAG: hypothetical protein A2190_05440 [Xanthomonadales bacterium RIFOXYA1_FULL_69_10]OHE88667.1 MAG: hypothetical protein A2579_02005 [Xanthomonadales bacterium RIFOXYD1_FULL_69_11]
MRAVLLFAVGLLAGANLLYFAMTRDTPPATYPAVQRSTPDTAPGATPPAGQRASRGDGVAAAPVRPDPVPVPDASISPPPLPEVSTTDTVPRPAPPARSVMRTVGPSGLLIPVQGIAVNALLDTFNDARGQSRVHDAIDIMAPRGTPVLAAADGTVEKLFTSDAGGLTIYQFEPSGRYAYYYAHLDRYAAGLDEGDTLRRGQVIGYVGSTGNASEDAPHLHFAIFLLGPEKRWWEGSAINPYPLLGGR